MKILHVGLCVNPTEYSSFPQAFKDIVGEENYRELPTGDVRVNDKIIQMVSEFKPDIIFFQVQAPDIIKLETFLYCHKSGAFIINWTGDKRHVVPQWMIDCAHMVDLTCFSNMEDVRKMRSYGFKSEFLEIGYDETIYTPIGEAYNVPEIVFFGNNYGAGHFPMSEFRIKMVEFLQKEYGNRFGVYGTGWPNAKGNINHSQIEEAKHYRGAKIAINCSHFDCDTYNSDRLLRILGTGIMCLSYDHVNMKNVYGNNIMYFKDLHEIPNKIKEILHNFDENKRVAGTGSHFFALNNFTFKHQVKNIIKLAS